MRRRRCQRGFTLIELMMALVAGVVVIAAMNDVTSLAFQARATTRQANESVYQGQNTLQFLVAKVRDLQPKRLTTPALADSTGDWFDPVMYCLKGGTRLVETTVSDTSCTGNKVILDNISAFSAQVPPGGAMDEPVATLSLTMQSPKGPVTLVTSVRLGAGLK